MSLIVGSWTASVPPLAADTLLPEGFVVPSFAYLAVLIVGVGMVAALLWALSPPVTDETVLALTPWMMVGGTIHALYQLYEFHPLIEPLLQAPAVYGTVALVAGSLWIAATLYAAAGTASPHTPVAAIGAATFTVLFLWGVVETLRVDMIAPLPLVITIAVTGLLTGLAWLVIGIRFTESAALTGWTGVVVVAGHTLDGVSTAVGYDIYEVSERSPMSARILEAGELLPTAEYVGAGWLFVLVKVLLAMAIVVLFREWVRDRPNQARFTLALLAALGLGPATHNLVLFTLSAG